MSKDNESFRIETRLESRAQQYLNQTAIHEGSGTTWQSQTYAELFEKAQAVKTILLEQDIQPGERIVVFALNSIEIISALLGIWFAHATVVLIDPELPAPEIQAQLTIADARYTVNEGPDCRWRLKKNPPSVSADKDRSVDIAAMLFTSGTTGDSKAVMLTHHNFIHLMQAFSFIGKPKDRVLTILPIFHVAGLFCGIIQPLYVGGEIILFKSLSAKTVQQAFTEFKPHLMMVVPRFLQVLDQQILSAVKAKGALLSMLFKTLLHLNGFLARFLRISCGFLFFKKLYQQFGGHLTTILCGSATLESDIQHRFLCYGFNVFLSYGLTETCGPITFTQSKYQWRLGGVGQCIDDLTIGHDGEILYRGDAMMKGYFRDPDATQKRLQEGWIKTQDIGYLDKQSNLYITGRKKEWIVFSNGQKIMPSKIEAHYQSVEGIQDCAVFTEYTGQQPTIYFLFTLLEQANAEQTKQRILQKSAASASIYRVNHVISVEKIPRTNTLKIKRHLLPSFKNQAPLSDLSRTLLDCFKALLPNEVITADTSFAELGIDSLLAMQLSNHIQAQCQVELSPTAFWFAQNIRQLAQDIQGTQKSTPVHKASVHSNDIAVIGMVGTFPGADNSDVFWENLLQEKNVIQQIPPSRWNSQEYYDAYPLAPGKMHSLFGGFIPLPTDFDEAYFKIKPAMSAAMDPQQKILLMQAKNLLTAHQHETFWKDSRTGVFIGAQQSDFLLQQKSQQNLENITSYTGLGVSDFSLASRIAFHFGLTGPAMVLKTACSSSLLSVHEAALALQHDDCDYAIAGGVNLMLMPDVSVFLSKAGLIAPDGKCKVFDESANGYVRSEGAGLVLLKRMEDALADKDRILAVIKGSAVNQDGASNRFAAPNGRSQYLCYEKALQRAGIFPEAVRFIEAHGIGTHLGDAVELESIHQFYDKNRRFPLYIGTLKSHIGHCEAAAGIAALIKTIQVLQHQLIPKNLHFHQLNKHIVLSQSSIQFPLENTKYDIRTAAVSAFGIAGTNVHIILERYKS